jgi:hypothetical protein
LADSDTAPYWSADCGIGVGKFAAHPAHRALRLLLERRRWWIYNSTTYPDKTYTWVGALMFIVYVWFFTKTTNVIRAT